MNHPLALAAAGGGVLGLLLALGQLVRPYRLYRARHY